MVAQLSFDKVYIISIWMESVLYGFLLAITLASLYVNITLRRHQGLHSRIMFGVGILMWTIATIHVGLNCFRLVQGYVIHAGDPGGPAAFFNRLDPWDHVMKDTLYATQEILGDAVAIYRTWTLWDQNWKVLAPLAVLFITSSVFGYAVCDTFTKIHDSSSIFSHQLSTLITVFYAMSFVQSLLTTGLMAYRIWSTDRFSTKYNTSRRWLWPYLRILIESAALQLVAELIVLALYASQVNAQYIFLESLTPLVGITFNAITIRISLRASETFMKKDSERQYVSGYTTRGLATQTIGGHNIHPARSIAISIKQDIETDCHSEADVTYEAK
ncbi:hypothetical protein PsYK624_039160 [Phanerochaete sordida]|uniref:Uncharacterized protein n=1 Tax=Phanerochaete sordida TaxID=48140 RepID=A0A9P3G3Z1_9APHY|nr:hypothetical protein PsYK624_039160 [Phanerochaete sordida]